MAFEGGGRGRGTILIGGKPYQIGSAEQIAASNADDISRAGARGTAYGTERGSASAAERGFRDPVALARSTELERQADEDRQRRYSSSQTNQASLQGILASINTPAAPPASTGGGGGAPSTIQFPTTTGGGGETPYTPIAPIAAVDTSAAQRAEFGRAKDQVGQASQGAMAGLRSALAGRGMLGSGVEGRQTARVATAGLGELGDVSRQQAITGADLAQRTAEKNYEGGITQRGQDTTARESASDRAARERATAYEGGITQRGQDLDATKAANDLQMQSYLAQMRQRGDVLSGLIGALHSGRSY